MYLLVHNVSISINVSNEMCVIQVQKVHGGSTDAFGTQFKIGDIVGCFLDVIDLTISESTMQNQTLNHVVLYLET